MDESSLPSHISVTIGFFAAFVFMIVVRKSLNAADNSEPVASKPAQVAIAVLSIAGLFAAARVIGADNTGASAYAFLGGAVLGLMLGHAVEPRRRKPER
jgi:hypothetical protein